MEESRQKVISREQTWVTGKGNKEAIKDYRRALEIDPKGYSTWGNLGVVYGRLGEYQKAFDCSRKIVRTETKHGPVWHNMGTTYKKLGDNRKAVGCCNKAKLVHSG